MVLVIVQLQNNKLMRNHQFIDNFLTLHAGIDHQNGIYQMLALNWYLVRNNRHNQNTLRAFQLEEVSLSGSTKVYIISFCLRPRAKDLGITRVVVVVVLGFFVWSMPYQLPPLCYPQFFKYFKSIYPSSSIFICQSINQPLPFPKYQYIIAADPGAGISPC